MENIKRQRENGVAKARKTAQKGLFRIIFSRAGIFICFILLQVGFFVFTTFYLQEYMNFVYGALTILSVGVVIYIINSESNPAFKLTWSLFVTAFPVFGALCYLFVKTQVGTRFLNERLATLKLETAPYLEQDPEVVGALTASRSAYAQLSYYLSHQLGFPTYRNTEIRYFPSGEHKFKYMLEELKKAQKFIFMEYFIIAEGQMWGTILKILRQKAKEGVEVRLMYDGMCAINLLPYGYPEQLKKYGIQCKMSNAVKPFLSTTQNNRDHRKICVVDGRVAFTGGINLADEYINKEKRFGHWKDTAVVLRGDAVQSFTMMFLEMWNVEERRPEEYQHYLTRKRKTLRREFGYVIPYADSPFDHENVGEEVYFHVLNHAKRYVHIMTPYLILDNEMMTTLTRVAKSGVEVIIVMPHIPDKWYAYAVAQTYYKELIKAGVSIYEYTPGFVHAKVFVSDDDTATVGSVNLDYRSLYLHFECGVFIYNNSEIFRIEEDFQKTLRRCHKMTLIEVKNRTMLTKVVGQVLRLIAPLM